MWFLVEEDAPIVLRYFKVFNTGYHLKDCNRIFLGTYQSQDGALIFHVFEKEIK